MARLLFPSQDQFRQYNMLRNSVIRPPSYGLYQNFVDTVNSSAFAIIKAPKEETILSVQIDNIDTSLLEPVIIGPRRKNRTNHYWKKSNFIKLKVKDVISPNQMEEIDLSIDEPIAIGPRQKNRTTHRANHYWRDTIHVGTNIRKDKMMSSLKTENIDLAFQLPFEDADETMLGKVRKVELEEDLHGSNQNQKNETCIIIDTEDPPTEIQEKISFLVNNLSLTNIDVKAKEFRSFFKEQYVPWFARHIVTKRAKLEPNFQDLYLKLIDEMNSKLLNQEIMDVTYETCKSMLKLDMIKSSAEERTLLNNLGTWLGKITFDRNQSLRESDINPISLILEAYETGLMTSVVPFICKILESIQSNSVYHPPHTSTTEILRLLVEIYSLPNLKMNLVFAIEILFRNLGLDLKEVSPANFIKNRTRLAEGNPDFSNKSPRMF